MNKSAFSSAYIHIIVIALIGLFAYSNTFNVPFQYDDEYKIVKNNKIRDLGAFFRPSPPEDHRSYSTNNPRYLGYLTFALNYKLHGLDVTGYHIINLIIHIINALLVYCLVILTFKTPALRKGGNDRSSTAALTALFSALFFVSHPLQTQAVTYIVQRLASLATLFYLLSILMYIKVRLATTDNSHQSTGSALYSGKIIFLYLLSLLSTILAMKTKELSFTLPFIIVLYEFIFFQDKLRKRALYLIPLLLTLPIIPLSIINLDMPLGELLSEVSSKTIVETQLSRFDYLITQFRVIVTYIRLLFLPVNQNLDYDYTSYHSLFNPDVLFSFIFLLIIAGSGIYAYYRYRNSTPRSRVLTFGILSFFITLSIESSIIPIIDVIYEHRMYLPSVFAFITIATALFMGIEKLGTNGSREKIIKTTVSLSLIIVAILAAATYTRNRTWNTREALWSDVVSKSPAKWRGYYNLGNIYLSQRKFDMAIKNLQIAIKYNPYHMDAQNNLGIAYVYRGLYNKAISHYHSLLAIKPYAKAHINLGNIYYSQGFIDKAINHFETALQINPLLTNARINLGIAYLKINNADAAMTVYHTLKNIDPMKARELYNIIMSRERGLQ